MKSLDTDYRENYLDELVTKIEDEKFVSDSRTECGRKGFTRNRKLTFTHLIILLVQGLTRSIQRELNSFYQKLQNDELAIQQVVKSSFTKARAKLSHKAFIELNKTGIEIFYRTAPYQKWKGFRLLAIDGSTAVLPNSKDIAAHFGTTAFGPKAASIRSVARCSLAYDVLNLTVLDAQLDKYSVPEKELAYRHFDSLNADTDLILFDRGYPGFDFMYDMQSRRLNYVIRLRSDWWLEVRQMMEQGKTDKKVTFKTSTGKTFRCRLLVIQISETVQEVLCTSLLDSKTYPHELFKDLYHLRWNIEEGYKLLKSRMQLEAFSGKTALSVQQDFFAKIFMMTTVAVLCMPVEEKIKREELQASNRKHAHKINRTTASSLIGDHWLLIVAHKKIKPVLNAIDAILQKTTEIIRPHRTSKRKELQKKPPPMNYKHL